MARREARERGDHAYPTLAALVVLTKRAETVLGSSELRFAGRGDSFAARIASATHKSVAADADNETWRRRKAGLRAALWQLRAERNRLLHGDVMDDVVSPEGVQAMHRVVRAFCGVAHELGYRDAVMELLLVGPHDAQRGRQHQDDDGEAMAAVIVLGKRLERLLRVRFRDTSALNEGFVNMVRTARWLPAQLREDLLAFHTERNALVHDPTYDSPDETTMGVVDAVLRGLAELLGVHVVEALLRGGDAARNVLFL